MKAMTLKTETWQQDPQEPDLWFGEGGLIVNSAALEERTYYYEVHRVPAQPTVSPPGERGF